MKVHLVDASPYIFRAYFAPGPSRPFKAVWGFAEFLLRFIREEGPTHLGVAFDESLTTSFRNEIYPDYKAQRDLPPPELEEQLGACREVAAALGAEVYVHARYEADDLIATVVEQVGDAVVVTNDKDLAQLVSDRVAWLDFAKGKRYGPAEVEARFGVRPDQIADLLGLAGDSVDNIPGVAGVGPKSAVALLRAFGHIEDVYERIGEVARLDVRGAKSLQAKLQAQKERALLSKRLSTAARNAPVTADPGALRLDGADPALVDPLFARFGMERLRDRIVRWRA